MKINRVEPTFKGQNISILRNDNLHKKYLFNEIGKIMEKHYEPYTVYRDKVVIMPPKESKKTEAILEKLRSNDIKFDRIG